MRAARSPVNDFLDEDFASRIEGFQAEKVCVNERAQNKVAAWQKLGSFVVANAGGYDLLGLNHIRGLAQCRILGAMSLLSLNEVAHGSRAAREVYDLAASDQIKLLVSIDTNGAIHENKSRNSEKGEAVRPILDWNTRAMMVASQSIPIIGTTRRRTTADFITRHGPLPCTVCDPEGCPHESRVFSVSSLGVDATIVKTDSNIGSSIVNSSLNSRIIVIDEQDNAYEDSLLAEPISTTAIVKRIRS